MSNLPTYDDDQDGGMRLQMVSDEPQRKPRRPRKPYTAVYYIGRESELSVHTVTLSIRGVRYAYTLTPQQCETVYQLCRKGLGRRALNYAKQRARNVEQISATST